MLPESERPPAEQDTGKFHDEAMLARAYVAACNARDEMERWVRYLEGKLNGVEVDIAQSQAFEQRTATGFQRLDDKLDRIVGMLEQRENDLLEVHEKVIKLDTWRVKHERSNVHCEGCQVAERAINEAQEA
jgi:hypothetical protein